MESPDIENNIVEEYIRSKTTNVSKIDKFLRGYPKFYFAKSFQNLAKNIKIEDVVVLQPSPLKKILCIPFVAFGVFVFAKLLPLLFVNVLLGLIILSLIAAWIGAIIWFGFLNPLYNYKIILDTNKVKIGKTTILWNAIHEVMIMKQGEGRNKIEMLIIFKNDKTILEYNLFNYDISLVNILCHFENFKKAYIDVQNNP